MVLAQFRNSIGIVRVNRVEKFLGLAMKLFQIGPDGQAADGHDEPPHRSPCPLLSGKGGSAITSELWQSIQVDSVLSADGRRPVRPTSRYHRALGNPTAGPLRKPIT